MKQFKRIIVLLLVGIAITTHSQNFVDMADCFEQLPNK